MTNNNLRYAELMENQKHNRETESIERGKLSESRRHSLAQEDIGYGTLAETVRYNSGKLAHDSAQLFEDSRANRAREYEQNRSNLARERETNRANLAAETEKNRANKESERLTQLRDALSYEVKQREILEKERNNRFMENEIERSHLADEAIKGKQANTQFWKGLGDFGLGVSREIRSWIGK